MSGPAAVTLAVGAAGGLSQAQMASWVFGMLLSAGLATLVMSLLYRQPLGFAWSIPGTVLVGPSLQHLSFAEVVGAFFGCGVLVLALGLTGVMRRVMAALPMPIVMAMVAAVFLRFGTDIVDSARTDLPVAGPMIAVLEQRHAGAGADGLGLRALRVRQAPGMTLVTEEGDEWTIGDGALRVEAEREGLLAWLARGDGSEVEADGPLPTLPAW